MSEASFASLGPTLLARKGGAKPAMRPQLAPLPETIAAEQLDDLGWNDMGQADTEPGPGKKVVQLDQTAAPAPQTGQSAPSPVQKQLRKLEESLEKPAKSAKTAKQSGKKKRGKSSKKTVAKAAPATTRRAAFTLRLDPERHLKLRLAATMNGTSAQALVTRTLDQLFDTIEELDAIAAKMKTTK